MSINRLVNVSVNPGGMSGAPETKPVPTGIRRGVDDEFNGIFFRET
jgi:hypothetical protein